MGSAESAANGVLGEHWAVWSTFLGPDLAKHIASCDVAGMVVESLTPSDARAMHIRLKSVEWYLGAVQVRPEIPEHWAVFLKSIPSRFRIFEDSLYLFHRGYELEVEDTRDHAEFREWEASALFSSVHWEDSGARETIFDPYDNMQHFRRLGEADELLHGQFSSALGETLMRCSDLDPNLTQRLHAAIKAFEGHETAEELAHVSVSCRRFTEKLADCLYPPREEKVGGRKVGQAEYRNRLWAYVAENVTSDTTRELLIANVEDLGKRIDKLDGLSNKGLHSDVSSADVNRLLLSLLVVAHDLISLRPPGGAFSYKPYETTIRAFMEEVLHQEEHPSQGSEE
ncbi:hypothetical protein J7I94_14315 [Streptomyces sp. ISL-12]|uniref:hypothetical protein n=1 Tax=Streptomyces sp. ISL-12 TaxID=2819177 RepID=UPI001BE722F6|nr:hypothetical protein [Streptomyces sp. ISL-12]MBT2411727.1 hypothetical protein [Streptomyces sp. ISL-12]